MKYNNIRYKNMTLNLLAFPLFFFGMQNLIAAPNKVYDELTPTTRKLMDVAISKTAVSNNTVNVRDKVFFQIKVYREDTHKGEALVSVRDSLTSNLKLISATVTSGNYNGSTGEWTDINLGAGDTATLNVTATVLTTLGGYASHAAWLNTMDSQDLDSTPGNNAPNEDDYALSCVIVPVNLFVDRGQEIKLTAPVGFNKYQWQKDGVNIANATSDTFFAKEGGNYTVVLNDTDDCRFDTCFPITIREIKDTRAQASVPFKVVKVR